MFSCTPSAALEQDWPTVQAVMDYRNARQAIDYFNQGREGLEQLGKYPFLQQILLDLHRAQQPGLTLGDVLADMSRRSAEDDGGMG